MLTVFWIILGIIFILYGLLVLGTGSGTGFFAVWLIGGAVCFFFAVAARRHWWGQLSLGVRKGLVSAIAILLTLFVLVEGLIISGFFRKPEKGADAMIVLGAQVYRSGPSVVLRYRLDAAYEYLSENENTVCIVTGAQGYNEPFPEAEGMKDYLVRRGIVAVRIRTDPASKNTRENIENSLAFLDPEKDSVVIVTNNFHLFRAMSLAKKAGIRHLSGLPAGSTPLYLANNMLRESFGVVKDFLKN